MPKMYTGVYWPQDSVVETENCYWSNGDHTRVWNNFASVEGPSYCVRLLVFEMPSD